jgi:hypothetical protein
MNQDGKIRIADIIESAIGDRIVHNRPLEKLCKDIRIHKNKCIEKYQLLGFKLCDANRHIYDMDHAYYQNNSQDIKDLQSRLYDSLKEAGYDVDHVVLQSYDIYENWSLSFTITTITEVPKVIKRKKSHAICI